MTVEELRDELNRLIARGLGDAKVNGFACQWPEGEQDWFEVKEVWVDEQARDVNLSVPFRR